MFPALLEEIGWNQDINAIPGGTLLSLCDSGPLDTFPFLLTFMNHWLKAPGTAVVFVSFRTAQSRLSSVFRKIFGLQLNMLAAQGRFTFIDGVLNCTEKVLQSLQSALKPVKTLVIFEGFAFAGNLQTCVRIHSFFEDLLCTTSGGNSLFANHLTGLFQWSRSLEADYPGRSEQIREEVECGGRGWLYLLERSHFVFCVRPLRSGMTREVAGELVAAFGPRAQEWSTTLSSSSFTFYPLTALYRMPTDTSVQLVSKGFLK